MSDNPLDKLLIVIMSMTVQFKPAESIRLPTRVGTSLHSPVVQPSGTVVMKDRKVRVISAQLPKGSRGTTTSRDLSLRVKEWRDFLKKYSLSEEKIKDLPVSEQKWKEISYSYEADVPVKRRTVTSIKEALGLLATQEKYGTFLNANRQSKEHQNLCNLDFAAQEPDKGFSFIDVKTPHGRGVLDLQNRTQTSIEAAGRQLGKRIEKQKTYWVKKSAEHSHCPKSRSEIATIVDFCFLTNDEIEVFKPALIEGICKHGKITVEEAMKSLFFVND